MTCRQRFILFLFINRTIANWSILSQQCCLQSKGFKKVLNCWYETTKGSTIYKSEEPKLANKGTQNICCLEPGEDKTEDEWLFTILGGIHVQGYKYAMWE